MAYYPRLIALTRPNDKEPNDGGISSDPMRMRVCQFGAVLRHTPVGISINLCWASYERFFAQAATVRGGQLPTVVITLSILVVDKDAAPFGILLKGAMTWFTNWSSRILVLFLTHTAR
jgi:hypothetical protein